MDIRTPGFIGFYYWRTLQSPVRAMQSFDEARVDIALLNRVVARDQQALGELYDRHSRLLFGLILRILKDQGEAGEVLQEVLQSKARKRARRSASNAETSSAPWTCYL